LSGIAIAIGVMVDVGIIFTENIFRHLEMPENHGVKGTTLRTVIYKATIEVSSAVITALSTTVVSFLPVFAMQAAEGKLFRPLAFTKTFALLSSFLLGIIVLPMLADIIFSIRFDKRRVRMIWNIALIIAGLFFTIIWGTWPTLALVLIGINNLMEYKWPEHRKKLPNLINIGITVLVAVYYLAFEWLPLGAHNSYLVNFLFVVGIVGFVITLLMLMVHYYEPVLRWCLRNKWKFLMLPLATFLLGITIWLGYNKVFGAVERGFDITGLNIRQSSLWKSASKTFPGIGKEFMPALDEGSFLLMPTSNLDYIKMLD
jgi:Cu(I)/Ag(I) efflux system membrane protein CusA/SilA